ncbi:MAG: ferredoxin [Planctomycetes bacterium]|nr:ferredoxin [Planctomycetota bacterium]
MADPTKKHPQNAQGPYYVDSECIDCRLCLDVAPACFQSDGKSSFVSKQPENEEEEGACRQAMEDCPVEAIGDDGA